MSSLKGWVVYGAIGVGVVGYNAMTSADRDSTGAIVGAGSVDAFEMKVGDCFNDSSSYAYGEEQEVTSVPGVPCSDSHDNEVYAVFDIGISSYPSDESMFDIAFDACLDKFEPFVGRDYQSSALDIYAMYPTRQGWSALGDREIVCAVYDMNANKLTGSVRGRAL